MYCWIRLNAGTGKSTLVKFIISALNFDPEEDVCYIAFTGKAALVLRDKGCPNAMTAHRLLYESFPRNDGTFFHKPKRPIYPYKVIVVDEISMLPKEMWELLLSHGIHVIALGDPGQLPPIGEDNGILSDPHVFLDEIMRQEADSEIIRLTMDIRAGKRLQLMNGEQVKIIDKKDLVDGMYLWADQIIVGKNETRRITNNLMRKYIHGVDSIEPIENDKVICLRNDWDHPNAADDVMVNGTIGYLSNIRKREHPYLHPMMTADFLSEDVNEIDLQYSQHDLYFRGVNMDYKLLTTGEPTVTQYNWKKFPKIWRPLTFDYGYCITCHKSQGSEYGKVLVFEEFLGGGDHARWLYTAATRAKDKLVIVRNA